MKNIIKTGKHKIYPKTGVYIDKEPIHPSDTSLYTAITNLFKSYNISTIYEFGCGDGKCTKVLITAGFNVDSSDGNPHTNTITNGLSYTLDLTINFQKPIKDAVLCLEVGEHIPVEYEQTVLDNISNHSSNIIILSWAVEGQIGPGHVNCRNNSYIIEQMKLRNWNYDANDSEFLKQNSTLGWFKNTIMVFKK